MRCSLAISLEHLLSSRIAAAWKAADAAYEAEIEDRRRRRDSLQKMIEGAEALGVVACEPSAEPIIETMRKVRAARTPATHSWTSIIEEIVRRYATGISFDALRMEVKKSPYGSKMEESDKGFYGAIGKLKDAKKLVKYKGYLFTMAQHRQFVADVAAGKIADLVEISSHNQSSPFGDAIMAFMNGRPNGATSSEIASDLKSNPEFLDTMNRNKTHFYNVLSRLVDKGELTKGGGRYYLAPKSKAANGHHAA